MARCDVCGADALLHEGRVASRNDRHRATTGFLESPDCSAHLGAGPASANRTNNQSAEPATEGFEMSEVAFEVLVYGALPSSCCPRVSRGEPDGHHDGQEEA